MAKNLKVELITPEGPVFRGEAQAVSLPGVEGSFQVLHNHAPMVSALGSGKIKLNLAGGAEQIFLVKGGVAEVLNNQVTALAEWAQAQ